MTDETDEIRFREEALPFAMSRDAERWLDWDDVRDAVAAFRDSGGDERVELPCVDSGGRAFAVTYSPEDGMYRVEMR